jgi:outer membrane protein assembly factor BamB
MGAAVLNRTRLSHISNVYASPVGADGRIYLAGRNGTTHVLQRTDELKVLAQNNLDDSIDASSALVGNQVFLRGSKFLYCIEQANP